MDVTLEEGLVEECLLNESLLEVGEALLQEDLLQGDINDRPGAKVFGEAGWPKCPVGLG